MGYKVIIIDGDLEAPSLIHLIKPQKPVADLNYWTDYLGAKNLKVEDIINPTKLSNLSIIYSSPPEIGKSFLSKNSQRWWQNALRKSLTTQKKLYEIGYDFIIIDNQSGTSLNSVNNMILADVSLLVVRPASYGVGAAEVFIQEMHSLLKGMKPRKDFFVWNQVPVTDNPEEKTLLNHFLSKWDVKIEELGIEVATVIPFDHMLNLQLLNEITNEIFSLTISMNSSMLEIVDRILKYQNQQKRNGN